LKTLPGNTRAGSPARNPANASLAASFPKKAISSVAFCENFAANDRPVELIAAAGVSYSGTACEVKMSILEIDIPNIALAETFQ
jgi:hypothetical protein